MLIKAKWECGCFTLARPGLYAEVWTAPPLLQVGAWSYSVNLCVVSDVNGEEIAEPFFPHIDVNPACTVAMAHNADYNGSLVAILGTVGSIKQMA